MHIVYYMWGVAESKQVMQNVDIIRCSYDTILSAYVMYAFYKYILSERLKNSFCFSIT